MVNNPIEITFFNAQGNGKHPISPYGDKEFIFITKSFKTLVEAYKFMTNEWSLSRPFDIDKPIKMRRLIKTLKKYNKKRLNNIAIDIDEVATSRDFDKILKYFKDRNIASVLGKSKNFNGTDNFNIKGILKIDIENKQENIEYILNIIKKDIERYGKLDMSVTSIASLQAPTKKNFILFKNEKGKIFNDSDIDLSKVKLAIANKEFESFDDDIVDLCAKHFISKGFTTVRKSDNSCVNFSHYSEVKSKGGYFWFPSQPFIMHHHNKSKSINIFKELKHTKEVKEYLQRKTLKEQEDRLTSKYSANNYFKNIVVNERYLEIDDIKTELINSFMKEEKSVLKIKSAMGTAKSTVIEHCIKQTHKNNELVLIVSNRISVSLDFSEKYNIMHYKNPDAYENKNSLVVQFDSLWKIDIEDYDVVIFDEFSSLLLHHRANLTDNANINAVKFKILLDTKRVVIADAFLTGFEDVFIKDRKIFSLENNYRDDITVYDYKNKEYFINSIIEKASTLDKGHISCSFTSLNMMKYVEQRLQEEGVKVISLSSETSATTREIIYRRFKEENHKAFEVILFTPTLTVGVSILNDTESHFHYDSSMSADVISSLQMIKRSRLAKEIHFFLEERQFYKDMDYLSIDMTAEKYIKDYYSKRDKTLLVDIDYETGNLRLQPLAKYINKIESYYNILENNHANSFRLLLKYQFKNKPIIIDNEFKGLNISSEIKKIKDREREKNLSIIEEYSDIEWDSFDLEVIKSKMTELSEEEKSILLMGKIQDKFKKKIPKEKLVILTKLEIESNFKTISKIKNFNLAVNSFKNNDYSLYILSKAISTDISHLQNKSTIRFLEFLTKISASGINLKMSYNRKELREIQKQLNIPKIEDYFIKMGYGWEKSKFQLDFRIVEYLQYI